MKDIKLRKWTCMKHGFMSAQNYLDGQYNFHEKSCFVLKSNLNVNSGKKSKNESGSLITLKPVQMAPSNIDTCQP